MKEINLTKINNNYTFDYLSCFEKPLGLCLNYHNENSESLFYLYLKMLQTYNTTCYENQELYIFDFKHIIRSIIEEKLNFRLNIKAVLPGGIHDIIFKQIDAGNPVLITVNLKELYYSEHYKADDWRYLMLINGYYSEKQLYSITDTTHTRFSDTKEGRDYKSFVIQKDMLENLYSSYIDVYSNGFVAFLENAENRKPGNTDPFFNCMDIFLNKRKQPEYREIVYMQEILGHIENNTPINNYGVDETTSEIDFVFTRSLNYKEIFYNELIANLEYRGIDDSKKRQLKDKIAVLLEKWNKIKSQCIVAYHIKRSFQPDRMVNAIKATEDEIKEFIGSMVKYMEIHHRTKTFQFSRPELKSRKTTAGETPTKNQVHADQQPADEIEQQLLDFWKNGFKKDNIGIHDKFYALGGHSLNAIRLITQIIGKFNVELPLDVFLNNPSIADIASCIKKAKPGSGDYCPIPRVEDQDMYILSAAQKRLFVIDQLNEKSITYNLTIELDMDCTADRDKINAALIFLMNRHEALRTYFKVVEGVPYQVIAAAASLKLEYAEVPENGIDAVRENFIQPFNLEAFPLLRALLIKINKADKSILLIDFHHIIVDGVSVSILLKELESYYNGKRDFSQPVIQYRDYTVWQEGMRNSHEVSEQENYWMECFKDDVPQLKLHTDYPRPALQSFRGDYIKFRLDRELTGQLGLLAGKHNLTLYMMLFAFFNILLHKYSGQEDIIVGSPLTDRPHADLESAVGMFVNLMPIRNFPRADMTLKEFFEEVKTHALEAYKNQDCQFQTIVEKLGYKGIINRNPLFDCVFVLQNIDIDEIQLGDKKVYPYQFRNKVSKFDLLFEVYLVEDEIDITFEFDTHLFKKNTIERMSNHYINIARQAVKDSDLKIRDVDILSVPEKKLILEEFNNTRKPFSRDKLIFQFFEEQAAKHPDYIAVEFANQAVTYGELNFSSNAIARVMREQGAGRGEFIAIIMNRRIELIEGVLGILKAGSIYVPLEPSLPDNRIVTILRDLKIRYIVTDAGRIEKVNKILNTVEHIQKVFCLDIHGNAAREYDIPADPWMLINRSHLNDGTNLIPLSSPDDPAYVIFTSGSTGNPKGVVVKHFPVNNCIEWVNKTFNVGPGDKQLFITSLSFDLSVYDIFGILAAGATIHLKAADQIKDPRNLLDSILKDGITFWDSAPQALNQLCTYFNEIKSQDTGKLRLVFLSGDWIPVSLPGEIKRVFPNAHVISLGGATEATIWSNYYPVHKIEPHWTSIPYGKPIQNAKYYILDKNLSPCPIGVPGDLYIGDFCLASGYINDEKLTADKFPDSPFCRGEKIYKTGDMARWFEDGNMEFLGRIDTQVKVRGFRVELGEIENIFIKHEDINEVAVLTKTDDHGLKYIAAYYTSSRKFVVSELKDFLSLYLPEYMIPSYFFQIDKMPVTVNGKLDRKALMNMELTATETGKDFVAPVTNQEIIIADIWKKILKLEDISIDDNFFDLGGNSLLLIEANNAVNKALQIKIPTVKIFQFSNIKSICKYLQELEMENTQPKAAADDKHIDSALNIFNEKLNLIRNY